MLFTIVSVSSYEAYVTNLTLYDLEWLVGIVLHVSDTAHVHPASSQDSLVLAAFALFNITFKITTKVAICCVIVYTLCSIL